MRKVSKAGSPLPGSRDFHAQNRKKHAPGGRAAAAARRRRADAAHRGEPLDYDAWDDPLQRELDRERELAAAARERAERPLPGEDVCGQFERLRADLAALDFRRAAAHEPAPCEPPEDVDDGDLSPVEQMLRDCRRELGGVR